MDGKKGFTIYHLLLCEGTAEFNLFAYLTRNKFKTLFKASKIQFSNRVEIIVDDNQIVSQGKLDGVSNLAHFRSKHTLIKEKYPSQRLFYFIDRDVDDSDAISTFVESEGDLIQFIEYNTEHMLISLDGKNPLNPCDFDDLKQFRDYCKTEFVSQYGKRAHKFKDSDFEKIFGKCTEEQIRESLSVLFSTLD